MDPEYSLFLHRILDELDTKYSSVSYQDLCKSLCTRFDLAHLTKLRSLLFYMARLDPSFPATLFREKMRCSGDDQQSKKRTVAADIVTMFNLIQMNGGATVDKRPSSYRPKVHKNQSFESCRSDSDVYRYSGRDRALDFLDGGAPPPSRASPCPKSDCNGCQHFIPAPNPSLLLGVGGDLKCRAASLDKLQHLPQHLPQHLLHYGSARSPSPCDMQSTYFPTDIDSESTTDADSLNPAVKETLVSSAEPLALHSCVHKRNIFKEDFHNLPAFSPQVITTDSTPGVQSGGAYPQGELRKPPNFFNHSFELPYSNPYSEPARSPCPEARRAKHESLDDLQASTYFGPTPVTECAGGGRTPGKPGRQPAWPIKSLSLNTEEGPGFERSFLKQSRNERRHIGGSLDDEHHYQATKEQPAISPSAFGAKLAGPKMKDASSVAGGAGADRREGMKRFKDKSINCTSLQGGGVENMLSVGTQTENCDRRRLRDFVSLSKYGEKHPFTRSEEDSDDISDIFRFLDDISVCGSTGVIQSSCYNSVGSLSQVKSDGDSSPEQSSAKLGKGAKKLERLFHSLESTDDELKASMVKLVLRIGQIEKKLESLSGVRGEISQVLSKLNKLDQKIQEPEAVGRQKEMSPQSELRLNMDSSPIAFRCHTTGHVPKADGKAEWCCLDVSAAGSDGRRVKSLKRSLFSRQSSRCLTEDSATESKIASISNSPRDWRPGTSEEGKEKDRDSKDRHRKQKEIDRSKVPKDSYLIEQVFSPPPFPPSIKSHMKGSPLYTDLRLSELPEGKRMAPPWGLDKSKLPALDLQTQDSLNPNNLEYWMEDIYTPGYDSLLKRQEAEFRRAKVCKIRALVVAAACTVILVIVVPICTMKS
ncbi:major intrinsically disordered Notch2-binding receptor 1-like isoform X2 [Anguilla anguilla]|uniref:major intrinsically disordered Notch2-binding receptor 1-like isoform X2 n=1 Tax=Anguilla anguilla TaxID=7936 RepID=UPI0015B0A182|nr:major intrinsically disordered Notch2-binding receptor 1-like isoform X2 [Anguilla anguilla]